MVGTPAFRERTVDDVLCRFADADPLPGAGVAAAFAGATAAALVEMAARASLDSWEDAGGVVAQARSLRRRLTDAADANASAYAAARTALDGARAGGPLSDPALLGQAMRRAEAVLLEIAAHAADVVEIGVVTAGRCDSDLRADVTAAVLMADASVRAVGLLVRANLVAGTTAAGDRSVTAIEQASAVGARRITAP